MRKTKEQNSKHKIPKTNNGITLIALVITIIVMLILVAVTISMAVDGGLFDFAGRAATETENAIEKEQLLAEGKIEIDGTWYNSIDEYVNATPDVHNWTRSGDTFTCSHCNAEYTIGDVVDYIDTGLESTTVSAEMTGLDRYYAKESKYPTNANVDENGIQTIEAQDVTWIVLGIEDTDKNGEKETLLITTQRPINSTGLNLYGAAAYNNGIDVINNICKDLYSNDRYGDARGMTEEDVNNCFQIQPYYVMFWANKERQQTRNLTTKLCELGDAWTWAQQEYGGVYYTPKHPDGTSDVQEFGEYVLNGHTYLIYDDGIALDSVTLDGVDEDITINELDVISGEFREFSYTLASRGLSNLSPGAFGLAFIGADNGDNPPCLGYGASLYASGGREFLTEVAFRPVVTIGLDLPKIVE